MNEIELRRQVLLSMQVALLGMVTAALRSVSVSWTMRSVRLRFVFADPVSESDRELVSEVETEMIASLPEQTVTCVLEHRPPPAPIRSEPGEAFVFRRAEP
jgi:hypothetical protein